MNDLWKKITGSILIAAGIITGGISIAVSINVDVDVNKPPVPVEDLGWAGPEAVAASQEIIAEMPEFRVVGDDPNRDYSTENVRLWDFTKQVNGGEHLPNIPQQVGDCVSFGSKNAINYLQAVQIARDGEFQKFRPVFEPYIYGTSRVLVGKGRLGCRSDGSVGAWAASAVQEHGVLFSDEHGVPAYSGKIARDWGCNGPPEEFQRLAREYPVRTTSLVRTADDARRAICNGYPVTIASNFGTETIREINGRMVAKWDGRWMHQMCLVAYDGTFGKNGAFYCLNSWGPRKHPQPLQGEPPGGFWIMYEDVDGICPQGDSYAYSSFVGFPAADDDFHFWIAEHREIPVIGQHAQEDIPMSPTSVLAILSVALISIGTGMLFTHRRGRLAGIGMMLGVCLAGMSMQNVRAADFDFGLFEYKGETVDGRETGDARDAGDFAFQMETEETLSDDAFDFSMSLASAKESTLPANVHVFAPDWCFPCKPMEASLGSGNGEVRIQWHHGDSTNFPGFVQRRASRDAYPVIHYQRPDGSWVVTSRTRTMEQLKSMITTGFDPAEAAPTRVETVRQAMPIPSSSGCQYVMSGGRMMLVCPSP